MRQWRWWFGAVAILTFMAAVEFWAVWYIVTEGWL